MKAAKNNSARAKHLITGGAGFIGSHLIDALMDRGDEVIAYDNLSKGKFETIARHDGNPRFSFIKADVLDAKNIEAAMKGVDIVWHLAADPDVRTSGINPERHLEQNTIATLRVLEAMRRSNVKHIAFTSTSTVYGDASVVPTPENYGPMEPISVYGAAKLGSEALISSFCSTFDMQGISFRFANIVGGRSTHGVTYDFYNKLKINPKKLEVLGNGKQLKNYCHVDDCVGAMIHTARKWPERFDVFNIGSDDAIPVLEVARIALGVWGLEKARIDTTGGEENGGGWRGDVVRMNLSTEKIKSSGWKPKYTSAEAIRLTAEELTNKFGRFTQKI